MKLPKPEIDQLKRQVRRAQHALTLAANDRKRFERHLAEGRFPGASAERIAQLRAVYAQALDTAQARVDEAASALTNARGYYRAMAHRRAA